MKTWQISLIWGVSLFIVVFIVNYFFILKRGYKNIMNNKSKSKNKRAIKDLLGLSYLVPKFKLDIEKMNLNYVFVLTSLINAFIISVVFTIICVVPWVLAFRMLLGFVLLFGLIYGLYELLGKLLVKKGWKK